MDERRRRKSRQHIEVSRVELSEGWADLSGFPLGLQVKTLSDDLDEIRKEGARTRLVRFAPGAATRTPLMHDYWEEVYMLSGDLGLSDSIEPTDAPTYSCRPPGTQHGPFTSRGGCILLEMQYYPAQ